MDFFFQVWPLLVCQTLLRLVLAKAICLMFYCRSEKFSRLELFIVSISVSSIFFVKFIAIMCMLSGCQLLELMYLHYNFPSIFPLSRRTSSTVAAIK